MAKYEYYVVSVEAEMDDSDDLEAELAREVEWMVDWECWDGVVTSFWGGPYGDKNVCLEQAMRRELDPGEIALPHPHYHDGTPVDMGL